MSSRVAVCIVARAPSAPGKTRLTGSLSNDRAIALRRALFLDTFDAAYASGVPVVVAYTPTVAREEFQTLTSFAQPILVPQSEGDLGARMHAAMVDTFAWGFDRVLLIGSDLPTLPTAHLVDAMQALERAPMVIGPAEDGGYYLIGLRAPCAELFHDIEWGSADVLERTLSIARRCGLGVERVPQWHDIDTEANLSRISSAARHTQAWLSSAKTS